MLLKWKNFVDLPDYAEPPQPLKNLLSGLSTQESKHFLQSIRKYNSAFQMTSFGANEQNMDGFMPTFKVKGQIYHRLGSILPPAGEEHKLLQTYFMGDSERETSRRCEVIHNLHHVTVADLQAMLHAHNPHIVNIKTALDIGNVPDL
eukprot:scpid19015/ scgid7183/ 